MKLTVFGATGGTGAEVVRQALAAGHEVRVVARRPEAVTRVAGTDPDRLTVLAADVLESGSLVDAVTGADAVVSALGARRGAAPITVYSEGTKAIVVAMQEAGVARLVAVSATPAAPPGEKTALERLVVHPVLERVFGVYADMRVMERVLIASELAWTVFRPPRLLDRPGTGHFRCAVGHPIPGGWTLPRADLATAMLAAARDSGFIRQAVTIAT